MQNDWTWPFFQLIQDRLNIYIVYEFHEDQAKDDGATQLKKF